MAIQFVIELTNMASPSKPVERRSAVHPDGVRSVRFANTAETVFATAGSQPGYGVKVLNARTTHTAFAKSLLSSASISWHPRLDYLAVRMTYELTYYVHICVSSSLTFP